ncbi:MAG: hypothetical protein K0R75_2055 [Paenibacillaceae bacterium]|jgi:spore coat protein CotF|nr:hypothetical protein [Paenibacillaceae bacterium]
MHVKQDSRLTSSELAVIWSSYLNNSLSECIIQYYLTHVEDPDVKSVLELALKIAEKGFRGSKELLEKDNQPMPVGFTKADVNTSAPRLFSDAFYLYYLENMSKVGLSVYGVALSISSNSKVRKFLNQAIQDTIKLYNNTADVLFSKGLFVKPPYVSTSDTVDFIGNKSYLSGLFHSDHRPLNVIEIAHIHANVQSNMVGVTLLGGFAQAAESKSVRDCCSQGKEIAKKHAHIFAGLLTESDLPVSMPWDMEVTDSTVAPFSDKLIMFHITLIIASSISNYATASAASLRLDIASVYVRLSAENAKYAKNSVDTMIKNNWLEQPPQVTNHKKLAKV